MPPRYDHRDVWWGGVVRVRVLLFVGCCSVVLWVVVVLPAPRPFRLFVPGVGGGLVVVCIVDAGSCSVRVPPLVCVGGGGVPLVVPSPPWFPWCGGWGWGCVFVLAC